MTREEKVTGGWSVFRGSLISWKFFFCTIRPSVSEPSLDNWDDVMCWDQFFAMTQNSEALQTVTKSLLMTRWATKRHTRTAKAPWGGGGWWVEDKECFVKNAAWLSAHNIRQHKRHAISLTRKHADSCGRCDPLVWVCTGNALNPVIRSKQTREVSPDLHFSLTVSPPCCSEWLLCIVESYWLLSPSAHPGALRRLATAMRDAFE